MNSALLIIDMQKGFLDNRICYPSIYSTLEYINAKVELFNEIRKPIFTIQDEDAKEEPGPKSYELIDSLKKEIINHHKISKIYSNAFWKTSLEKDLRSQNINFLVLTGFAAEGCVNYTYNGALERDFNVVLLKNGITSYQERYTQFIQEICDTISYSTLSFLLSNKKLK